MAKLPKIETKVIWSKIIDGDERRWEWSVVVFSGKRIFADCFIKSALSFDTRDEAQEDFDRVMGNLGLTKK
jgi:hypothetical protein